MLNFRGVQCFKNRFLSFESFFPSVCLIVFLFLLIVYIPTTKKSMFVSVALFYQWLSESNVANNKVYNICFKVSCMCVCVKPLKIVSCTIGNWCWYWIFWQQQLKWMHLVILPISFNHLVLLSKHFIALATGM